MQLEEDRIEAKEKLFMKLKKREDELKAEMKNAKRLSPSKRTKKAHFELDKEISYHDPDFDPERKKRPVFKEDFSEISLKSEMED